MPFRVVLVAQNWSKNNFECKKNLIGDVGGGGGPLTHDDWERRRRRLWALKHRKKFPTLLWEGDREWERETAIDRGAT